MSVSVSPGGILLPPKNTQSLEEAFPKADIGTHPAGSNILIQVRTPKGKIGSLFISDETKETNLWNTQVGKVIAMGPLAFRNRETKEEWVEGAWAKAGDFVRFPKYVGDKQWVPIEGTKGASPDEKVLFIIIKDTDVLATVDEDKVLEIVAYV